MLTVFVLVVVAEGVVHVIENKVNTNVDNGGAYVVHNYEIALISIQFSFPIFCSSKILFVHCCLSYTCDQIV